MPDPNTPLEVALREIREIVPACLDKKVMTVIRSIFVDFKNKEVVEENCRVA